MDYSHITHHKIARHAASRRRLGTGSPGWALIASPSESEAKWQLCLLHLIDFKGRLTVGSLKSPNIFSATASAVRDGKCRPVSQQTHLEWRHLGLTENNQTQQS